MGDAFLVRATGALAPRYQVTREIGRGGMAVVLEAMDTRHQRAVAIKVVMPELAASAGTERFLREIEVLASLQHRGIVPLFDSGLVEGMPFLVMPFVRGESLRKRLDREKQLTFADGLSIATELIEAIEYAHRRKVVHRDIKPANILLEDGHAILADFGIASALSGTAGPRLTQTGVSIGTPHYMSPEQASGERVDARSDVYALGCVLHEMLGGEPPFTGPTAEVVIRQHLSVAPRAVTTLRPNTPPHVVRAILRALSKSPAERFQSAAEFGAALREPREGEVLAEAATRPIRRWRSIGRNWNLYARVASAALPAMVVAWLAWVGVARIAKGRGDDAAAAPARHPVLVAEFESPGSDPSLPGAARQLVMASLDQSDRFESVPLEQIKQALALAGKPDSARLDGALARELAFRSGIKVTLEGRLDRLGSTFAVILVARDAENGQVLGSVTGQAQGEDGLIPELGKLTREIREKLGEQSAAITLSGPRWTAATPSFEAYRKYSTAFEMQQIRGDDRGSIVLLNETLQIDPDFAEAWALKMFAHGHMGEGDSARIALDEALRRPQRLTEDGRMFLEGLRDSERGDLDLAEAKYRELIRRGYQLSSSLGNYGSILWAGGRYEEALEQYSQGVRASRFGPQQWVLGSEVQLLLMFGRVTEARAGAARLRGAYGDEARLAIAVTASEWGRADSLALAFVQSPIRAQGVKAAAEHVRGSLLASRGAVREARSALSSHPGTLLLLEMAARSIGLEVDAPARPDSLWGTRLLNGLDAASRGDISRARFMLAEARQAASRSKQPAAFGIATLDGALAGAEGDHASAALRLAPVARFGERPDLVISPVLVRWLAADAFDRSHQPDSAAAFFQRALEPDGLFWQRRVEVRLLSPFVHIRLARLYARTGKTREAASHRQAAIDLFTKPDPELRELLRMEIGARARS